MNDTAEEFKAVTRLFRLEAPISDNPSAELIGLLAELMKEYKDMSQTERRAAVEWFRQVYGG